MGTDTRRICVTEALNELKSLDKRIYKIFENVSFVGAKKKSSDRVGAFKVANFESNAKAAYQSAVDLINNRAKLKAAIVQSNAVTYVEIAGKRYTVAEAIERKNSIAYDKQLLSELQLQWKNATETILRENNKVEAQSNKMLESFLGKDSSNKISEQELSSITDPYKAKNEYELVDPLGVYEKIRALEEEITAFEAEVDVRLSISNSTTYIDI